MPMMTSQQRIFDQAAQSSAQQSFATVGTVVDTNDPQENGRVRVLCPQWGDSWSSRVEDLPWAVNASPLAGTTQVGTRGPGIQSSEGNVAYGMWAIPKVGAQAIVICVDGNPMTRACIGFLHTPFTAHTLPHGRFMYDDHPALEKTGDVPAPYGPYTSSEKYIHPLAENMQQAFGHKGEPNYEYRSRGADYTAARIDVDGLGQTLSKAPDDKDVKHDNWTSTQGYQVSRTDPNATSTLTDRNYDSMVYSMTSPGFHSFSMDDRQENCRVRLRTTSGHQIIMDDTNERIYIATAQGNNWIELDQNGNIDVFTTNKLNVHAAKELNFTSDETIRMHAKKGIHMHSDEEIRMHAVADVHVKSNANIRTHSTAATYIQSDSATHIKSGSTLNLSSSSSTNINAGGNVLVTGSNIHLNGPTAASASSAGEQEALWTNRVPLHEPWARSMTKHDKTHEPEFSYTDDNVNRVERGMVTERGMFWRR